ncbi:MAG: hypothetical protein AAGF44_05160 [Pseudomonadota bacterium]
MKRHLLAAALSLSAGGALAADGTPIEVTGEMIDTWCYFSGVMGGPDAVVGTAHHTCALWCSAAGIPVGLLTEDGTVYMVVKWEGDANVADGQALLDVQSHQITAKGTAYLRDGINYIFVEEVVANDGIVNRNHVDYGLIPSGPVLNTVKAKRAE